MGRERAATAGSLTGIFTPNLPEALQKPVYHKSCETMINREQS